MPLQESLCIHLVQVVRTQTRACPWAGAQSQKSSCSEDAWNDTAATCVVAPIRSQHVQCTDSALPEDDWNGAAHADDPSHSDLQHMGGPLLDAGDRVELPVDGDIAVIAAAKLKSKSRFAARLHALFKPRASCSHPFLKPVTFRRPHHD